MRQARFCFALAAFFLIFASPGHGAAAPADPAAFVKDLADKVLAIFNDPRATRADKESRMFPIAVAAFDVPRTARFVLGRFWKDTPQAQREEFTEVFKHYMVHIYTGQFDLYHDVEFQIGPVRSEDSRTLVRSKIVRHDGGPSTPVDWWVAKSGDGFRIIDVTVEGVSQLVALREQFTAVIDQHDGSVAALIEHLREKIAQ